MTDTELNRDDLEFEDMMKSRFEDTPVSGTEGMPNMDQRLRDMNKKLPDWDLEPPFTFLK